MSTKLVATTSAAPWTSGTSRSAMPRYNCKPMPGQVKIASVMTAPPSSEPICSPITVSTGSSAFLSACRRTSNCSPRPLARATSTYSCVSTSSSDARVIRAISAAEIAPSVTDGNTRCWSTSTTPPSPRAETMPDDGSRRSVSENTRISTRPSQKLGVLLAVSATSMTARSTSVCGRNAATVPARTPVRLANSIAHAARTSVLAYLDSTSGSTGSLSSSDRPRSPCSARPSQVTYWTGTGRSSPSDWRTSSISCADAFGPASTYAASPGISLRVPNTTTETPNSTKTDAARRRRTNAVTPALSVALRRQPNVVERVRPGVRIHEATDLLVEGFRLERMEHVDPRHVVVEHLLDLLVDLRRGGRVSGRASLQQQLARLCRSGTSRR